MKAPLCLAATLLFATPIALLAQAPAPSPVPNTPPAAHSGPPPMYGQGGPRQHGEDGGGDRPHMRRAGFEGGMHGEHEDMHEGKHEGLRGGEHGSMHHEFWKNPQLVARIGLTPEQTKHLDDISLQSRMKLIQMHATLAEQRLMLEPLLSSTSFDAAKATAEFDKIADTRAAIEKEDAKTMLGIRAVLTPEQWTKLHSPQPRMGPGMGMHGNGGPDGSGRGGRGGPAAGGPAHFGEQAPS